MGDEECGHSSSSTTDRERDDQGSLTIPAASGQPFESKIVSYAQALASRGGGPDEGNPPSLSI